jgi:hypothetical protein
MAEPTQDHPGTTEPRITRRSALAGLTAAAAAAVLGPARHLLAQPAPAQAEPDVVARRVSMVPAVDPGSAVWERAAPVEVALMGQAVSVPTRMEPSVPSLRVSALHDGRLVAFRLEWKDARRDSLAVGTTQFRDSCGVMLGRHGAPPDVWFMGRADAWVTMLHWRADWQLDMDAGFQDVEAAFPNVAFDFYPPLVGVERPRLPHDYPPGTRIWLPGWHVGNPLSQPRKHTPVEKLWARGPGTISPLPTQDAVGRGIWRDGTWRVVLARGLAATDRREVHMVPGRRYGLAFAIWSGAERDVGARKSITRLGQLRLEAA